MRSDSVLSRRAWCCAALCAAALAGLSVAAAQTGAQTGAPRDAARGTAKAAPAPAAAPTATPQRQRQLQAEQRELQQRLTRLKQQMAATEASRGEVADALAESERAISAASRRLRELAAARAQVERQIAALQERSRATATRQSEQERQLGAVLRTQFALAQTEPWQRVLEGGSAADLGRELGWLDYVARTKADLIGELRDRRAELAELEAQSREKRTELASIAGDEQASRTQLLRQQAARKATLDRLAQQLAGQRQSLVALERDERRLSSLVEEIARVLAEQARREAQRASQRRESATAKSGRGSAGAGPTLPPEPPNVASLEKWRGKLQWPVKGDVSARFGSPRRTEAGVNAPTWKGVFIRATAGADVRAAAAGRVVYADWLRGFGNLLIVDHGESFLTVYGNNETLLASSGERVAAGEVIATVGNTGGNQEPGLYFEMRLQGQPVDPLKWAAAR
jgi:septal ring factor EnvC (AmiA/AmiB activator)